MKRRTVLAALGGTAAAGVAGCTGSLPLSSSSGESLPESRDGSEPDGWPDAERFRGDWVAGPRKVESGTTQIALERSAERVTDGSSIEFTLRNDADEPFGTSFNNWQVFKHVDDRWFIIPHTEPIPQHTLSAGETHTWPLTIDNAGVEDGEPVSPIQDHTVEGLGGGYYAFGISGLFDEEEEGVFVLVRQFELDEGPIQLTPTDAVGETTWDGDVLVVTTDRNHPEEYPERHAEDFEIATYELERVDEPDGEPTEWITEQVLQNHQLRDAIALAHEHDADRVRIEEHTSARPPFGVDEPEYHEYQGSTYKVTSRAPFWPP